MSAATRQRRVTGERVFTSEGGFNPTWQRHVAAYAAAAELLGGADGRVLDLGCGIGHSYTLLGPRKTVGVDLDGKALAGQDRETHVADMRALPFAPASFAAVVSVQSIEHVRNPERVIDEVARVLVGDGSAIFVTPNRLTFARPEEIIDPYHHVEYDAPALHALCRRRFADVRIIGLFGSERYLALVAEQRARLDALLRRDPLRLRRVLPRRLRQRLYDAALARERRGEDARTAAIEVGDFSVGEDSLAACLDLIACCRGPGDGVPKQFVP